MRGRLLLALLLAIVTHHGAAAAERGVRSLTSRPLHDAAADSNGGAASGGGATAPAAGTSAAATTGTRNTRASARNARIAAARRPPPPPSWELELAPHLPDLYPPHDANTTVLQGPPHLSGVFKGMWMKDVYGDALRRAGFLRSDRGVIILQLPADQNPPPKILTAAATAAAAAAAEAAAPAAGAAAGAGAAGNGQQGLGQQAGREREVLPGGVQELKGELVLRDGPSITDRDIRFRLRGSYVAAAGAVHVVLEPQLPYSVELSEAEAEEEAEAARRAAAGAGGEGSGGAGRSYRAALRTAARNLVLGGPFLFRTLLRARPPPPPRPSQAAAAASSRGQPSLGQPPSPPQPPLALALRKTCEFRAHFKVYYKGDPEGSSHVSHLQLDVPAPPPPAPPPPRRRGGWFGAALGVAPHAGNGGGDGAVTLPTAATASAATPAVGAVSPAVSPAAAKLMVAGGGVAAAAAVAAGGGAVAAAGQLQRRRRLTADTEIFHSTQMQLHGGGGTTAGDTGADGAGGDAAGSAAASPGGVYGIPPGMDPRDPDLELIGLVVSPNCDLSLAFNASSVHLERYYRQVLRYSVMITTVTIAQIVLTVGQSEAASTPSAAARTSLYAVTLQAILDAYQCLVHLTGALVVDSLFGAFASIAFLQFLLFAVFEMRQALLVWRAQRTSGTANADFWTIRRDMSAVYTRFYAMLLLGLLLLFQLQSYPGLLVLVLHSWWLPQIVHSARSDTRPPLKTQYLWGMSGLRLINPLYLWGCPSNLLRIQTQPAVCAALVAWVALQAGLLQLQMRLGPRAFVPGFFLPQRYNYHRPATRREMGIEETGHVPAAVVSAGAAGTAAGGGAGSGARAATSTSASAVGGRAVLRRLAAWMPNPAAWFRRPGTGLTLGGAGGGRGGAGSGGHTATTADGDMETGHGSKECVICMNPVPLMPASARMLTPCGHFFHEPCLTRWIVVNSTCPTCRGPVPPP